MRHFSLSLWLVLALAVSARAETLISSNASWRYFPGTSEASSPTNAWRNPGFDASAWLTGAAPFHFGTNNLGGDDEVTDGTILNGMLGNYTCVFFRKEFVIADTNTVLSLFVRFVVDDGMAVWLNGTLVRNAAAPPSLVYTNVAPSSREAGQVFSYSLGSFLSSLLNGTNVLAVQAFNYRIDDPDFRVAVWLDGEFNTPPTIEAVAPLPGSVLGSLSQIAVSFSKSVTGVDAEDLLVNEEPALVVDGGTATNFYVFTFNQPAAGPVQVAWNPGHGITDFIGNQFDDSAPEAAWTYTLIDILPPVVATVLPAAGATVRSLGQVEVTFSEPVNGVNAADLLVNGVPAAGMTGSGLGPYVFSFAPPASGLVQFSWAGGHGITDRVSPPNAFAGDPWSVSLNPSAPHGDVVINEILASNVSTNGLRDGDGDREDWIEIHNRGSAPVNLAGWSLSDDPRNPNAWTFPPTNLGPGQFLVVFASAKDRRVAGFPLHTSFKLAIDGEYLGLFGPEYPRQVVTEMAPGFPEQRNDYSYGLVSSNAWRYFTTPTPGAPNGSSTISNLLLAPHFNVGRGLFDRPFSLILSSTEEGTTIRYSVNGSEPTEAGGLVYTGPMTITNTTVLRAAAFRTNALPSVTITHTYLFLDQVVQQPNRPAGFPTNWGPNSSFPGGVVPADYEMDRDPLRVDPNNTNSAIDAAKLQRLKDGLRELPTVSIVMKLDDIFGTAGLYQRSAVETGSPGNKPENKKPCSVEMILPDGTTAFVTTCGIDLHGNASRNPVKNPKHGFKLTFRGDFGPATLQYRLFEDSPVEEYDDLLLRADFNSSWRHWSDTAGQGLGAFQRTRATRTRDAWMKEALRDMGGLASHSRFCHLYLNGLYWGTFDFSEDPTETFARTALGGSDADFDVIDQGVLKNGTLNAYNAMIALPAAATLAQYEQYHQYLNVPEFIDYMLLHFLIGHQDWATTVTKNWSAIRKRVAGAEGTFRYIPWDGECILLNEDVNRVTVTTPPSGLHTKLDDSAEYRLAFADRVQRHLVVPGGSLTPAANLARWQKWQAIMDKPIVAESVRWGDYRRDVHQYSEGTYQLYTRENHWLPENARMVGYFSNRTATVLTQLRNAGLYPTVSAPSFNQQGGRIAPGFTLTMSGAAGTIYYTTNGADPRIYGTGAVSPDARAYSGSLVLNASINVKARALSGSSWSALNEAAFVVGALGVPLRITEIMYNPPGGDAYEYLELQNVGSTAIPLTTYSFSGISFTFPVGFTLNAGQRIVLGSEVNTNAFKVRYPGVAVAGWFGGALANGGERIAVLDANGATVVSVDYNDANGWPTEADGGGYSIEIVDVNGDPDDPANWHTGLQNGTPGQPNSVPPTPVIILNEIMADNATAVNHGGTFPDWIELHNTGAAPVNLAGWSLTDDGDARKFVFPGPTMIPAGGYLVVWCDAATNSTPGLHTDFALGRNGESVLLYDAATNRVDAITFGPQATDYSVGRVSGDWTLTTPTTNAANLAVSLGAATNVTINEWLANAPPGSDDWLELFNQSAAAPVALHGMYLATSNALFQIRSLSFLGPRAYVQLMADEQPGANNLDFKLPAGGGAIVLYDATGNEVQRVTYGAQTEAVSQGRLPDASVNVMTFPGSTSPGASNYVSTYTGPRLNEVLARNDRAVVSPFGTTADYVELFNPTAAPFDLGGMGLSDDAGQVRFRFAPGTTIAANGYLVVWCDGTRAAQSNGVLSAGFALSGSDGGVYLFNATGQAVDSVEYGFQVQDLPMGLSSGQWRLLAAVTPGAANASAATLGATASLRINEWMADPLNGDDWFELYNPDPLPVDMSSLHLTDDPSLGGLSNTPIASLSFIGGGRWVTWIADDHPSNGRDHTAFSLDKYGDMIRLYTPDFTIIDTVSFGLQLPGVSQGSLPDGAINLTSFAFTPSPGGANYLPLTNVVINEVLAHTDSPLEDAIELFNPTASPVNIGGWYLSNSERDLKRYRIPDGTTIAAGGFKVFYEYQFDPNNEVPPSFALNSAHGDSVYLSQADAGGNLTGDRASVAFGAAENGVSFGRYVTSVGADFVAQTARTFGRDNPANLGDFRAGLGLPNAGPRVGPVIINEIMYHPASSAGSVVTEIADEEYVDLFNAGASTVPLYDPAHATNLWRLSGAVEFEFPAGSTLAAGQHLLVVNFDPATDAVALASFRAKYSIPVNTPIMGPWSGRLDNAGESVELYKPDRPQTSPPDAGFVPLVLVERVQYQPVAPWPPAADGTGFSLHRVSVSGYANDPTNWVAAAPSPGAQGLLDTDGDGMPDAWETANGLNPSSPADAGQDFDGDGLTNLQEYDAGTDPRSADSVLALEISVAGSALLEFQARAGRSYTIESSAAPVAGSWQKLIDIPAGAERRVQVSDPSPSPSRFYRLRTP